jgi:arylsulfatase A-like enzyme
MRIILIALDTLRADHLSCYGWRFPTTPQIDAWAEKAVLFERCYASDVPTPPSYTAMFSGRFGVHNGIFGFQDPGSYRRGAPMMQQVLASAGWETCALSNLFYVCPWLLPGWGTIMPPGLRFQGGRAPEVTDTAIRWLEQNANAENSFLFVHYWEPHQPFTKAPGEHRALFPTAQYEEIASDLAVLNANPIMRAFRAEYHRRGEGDPHLSSAEVMARYDSQVHFVDAEVGRLLAHIDADPADADTAVIIVSDHGEAFGEYGTYDHYTCYENIAHVPLLIRAPGKQAETRVKGLVYGADLMPTVLELAGCDTPGEIDGSSLVACLEGRADGTHEFIVSDTNSLATQRMLVRDSWSLVHTLNPGAYTHIAPYELFDLEGDCEQDLSAEQPELARELRLLLEDWVAEQTAGGPDPLQEVAATGGWTFNHGMLVHAVLENLEIAQQNKVFWETFRRHHGGAVHMLRSC